MVFVTIRDSYRLELYRNVGNIRASTGRDKMIQRPTMKMTKVQLVEMAQSLNLPERNYLSEFNGPLRKDVIVFEINKKLGSK